MQTKPPRWTPYVRHPDFWWFPPKQRCRWCDVECREDDPWEDGWQERDDGFWCCECAALPVKKPKIHAKPEPPLWRRLWAGLVVMWNER